MLKRIALCLAALSLVACAPVGAWEIASPGPSVGGLTSQALRVDLRPGGSVVATVVGANPTGCSERYDYSATGRWFINAVGQTVIDVQCSHNVGPCALPDGTTRVANVCLLIEAVGVQFDERNGRLVSWPEPRWMFRRAASR